MRLRYDEYGRAFEGLSSNTCTVYDCYPADPLPYKFNKLKRKEEMKDKYDVVGLNRTMFGELKETVISSFDSLEGARAFVAGRLDGGSNVKIVVGEQAKPESAWISYCIVPEEANSRILLKNEGVTDSCSGLFIGYYDDDDDVFRDWDKDLPVSITHWCHMPE